MDNMEIKQILNSSTYDFLRNNEKLKGNIMLLTVGGSHAYGTNIPTSDLDIRGIALETLNDTYGLGRFEQFENRETDTTIYALRKVTGLLMNCNPNVIEMLGTNEDQVFDCDLRHLGTMLRDNRDLFLTKKAFFSFGGYATAQLRRLQNALARDEYDKGDKEEHICKTIQQMLLNIEGRYSELNNGYLKLYTGTSSKADYDKEIFMDIQLNNYPLRDFKNIYSDMNNVVKDYEKLNHRNSKKDELHLNKHIMHLFRLLAMGAEILEGKGINTNRTGIDLDFLMGIRNGDWIDIKSDGSKDYSAIISIITTAEKRLQYAYDNSPLRAKPDYNKINDLLVEIAKSR